MVACSFSEAAISEAAWFRAWPDPLAAEASRDCRRFGQPQHTSELPSNAWMEA